jgi:hypothetical protein
VTAALLGEIEPSGSTQILDIDEILYQTLDDLVGIGMALGFTDGRHW